MNASIELSDEFQAVKLASREHHGNHDNGSSRFHLSKLFIAFVPRKFESLKNAYALFFYDHLIDFATFLNPNHFSLHDVVVS